MESVARPDSSAVAAGTVVLVPVGELDRRAYEALRCAVRIPGASVRALHVSTCSDDAHAYAMRWTRAAENIAVPLEIIEAADGVTPPIRAAVESCLRQHTGPVTVVIGRLRLRRRWHRLLHDHSAEQIRSAICDLDRVLVEFIDIPVRP
jgi:hypothetical protein